MAFCEANKVFSENLAKDSVRGRAGVLKLGYWPAGEVPFGYDKEYTDGTHTIKVKRTDTFRKGRN